MPGAARIRRECASIFEGAGGDHIDAVIGGDEAARGRCCGDGYRDATHAAIEHASQITAVGLHQLFGEDRFAGGDLGACDGAFHFADGVGRRGAGDEFAAR